MTIRIGVDVGGTFTDAVAIDNDTFELLEFTKVFTTYGSKDGVALGIIDALSRIISNSNVNVSDISFIAAGTTQATNAILEGDVCDVGVILIGNHIINFSDIPLGNNKYIHIKTYHINNDTNFDSNLEDIFHQITLDKINSIVASCPFSPDDNTLEQKVLDLASKHNIYATATYEISGLYSIKIRTNTAIINASILPKMMSTFELIKKSIRSMGITAPVMIMRCDGGVMPIDEIKKRPFLTILSGPAAGVYGALIYEKISSGIFLEVGGTSTDISIIKDGKVVLTKPTIGGHKLYLNSLDINTIAIAGGSLIRVFGKTLDVGPRSSHILGLKYSCFAEPSNLANSSIFFIESDNCRYAAIKNSRGEIFSITLTCILNALGLVPKNSYCFGSQESARLSVELLAQYFKTSIDVIANKVLDIVIQKYTNIINQLAKTYKLNNPILFGGGGACNPLISIIASRINSKSAICKNAPVIASIGICMSVVMEVMERNVFNPSHKDIESIKLAVFDKLSKSISDKSSIEILVEFDRMQNILRAIATSTIDSSSFTNTSIDQKEIISFYTLCDKSDIYHLGDIGKYFVFKTNIKKKILWGLINNSVTHHVIVDNSGIICFDKRVRCFSIISNTIIFNTLKKLLEENSICSDAGILVPPCMIVTPTKLIDLSSFTTIDDILKFLKSEIDLKTAFDVAVLIE
ncbi:MAG: hydantoinase/oxoprolinase family protein [Clostridiales bacterium]|nr:hydantoinase/oxoprolinase family protein [Clostridiales bacterium]